MNKKLRKKPRKKTPKIVFSMSRPPKPIIKLDNKAKVKKICKENHYTFKEGYFVIGNYYPDFINTERKLIIEVFDPKRSANEIHQRLNTFHKHGYKMLFIHKGLFKRDDGLAYIAGMIGGFSKK